MGTKSGEARNRGYNFCVRYGNVKWAMLGQLQKPTPGFEDVIKNHFCMQRNYVAKMCDKWLEEAETLEVDWSGSQENRSGHLAKFTRAKKGTDNSVYVSMLKENVDALKREMMALTVIRAVYDFSDSDDSDDDEDEDEGQQAAMTIAAAVAEVEEEAVAAPADAASKAIDAKFFDDRMSRVVMSMGMEAVKKQTQARIFVHGVGGLGIEIAKNVVLSGVKQLTVHDPKTVSLEDLGSQFFLRPGDVGKNRAAARPSQTRVLLCASLHS